jgi:tetratricopeptide (TPR) repeat protein
MDEAAQLNEAMLARDPDNFGVLLNLLYLARFVDSLNDKVDELYSRAKQINPQVPLIYAYYGAAMAHQGKYDAAAAAARKAIELRPDYPEPHVLLGEVLEQQNKPGEAVEQYQRALVMQSSDHTLQLKLWRLLIIQGRSREVIPQLIPALQIDDSYAALRGVLLGEAYLTTGDLGKAKQYLQQARNRASSEGSPELVAQIDQELEQIARRP